MKTKIRNIVNTNMEEKARFQKQVLEGIKMSRIEKVGKYTGIVATIVVIFLALNLLTSENASADNGDYNNVELVGRTLFGEARDVYVTEDYAYVGAGKSLLILDISQKDNPELVGYCDTNGSIQGVHVVDNYAYIADFNSLLRIIDVTDKENPKEVGHCYTDSWLWDVFVLDDYAYVVGGDLDIIDISNKENPHRVGFYDSLESAWGVYVLDDYAYVADGLNGLFIIDVSDKENPYEIGSYNTDEEAWGVYVLGDYAYVGNSWSGLRIIDVSDKENPNEVGYYDTEWASDVYVIGDFAYVADSMDGLRIIDISDKENPGEVGYYDNDGRAWTVSVLDEYAYIADDINGLRIIDVSNKENPYEVGFYNTGDYARDVYVLDEYAYVADWGAGLRIIDISDDENPNEVGYYDTISAMFVYVLEDYAYVGYRYLHIIDISDKENPIEVGNYDTQSQGEDIHVVGNYAYIAANEDGLRIIDVSDKENPNEVGYYDTIDDALGVYVSDNYAYVAENQAGLSIIDVSIKQLPREVGYYDTNGRAYDVYVLGNYAFVADGDQGLRIIDVSDKENPNEVGYYDTNGIALDVYIIDNYAYVADGSNGLCIIDVRDKEYPDEVGFYNTYSSGRGVHAVDDYIYIADNLDGLYILKFNAPKVEDLSFSNASVYKTDSIKIYANGSDNEDIESDLTCQIQFNGPLGIWTDLDDEKFVTDHWEVNFPPPEYAERGIFDFRVKFTDSDGAFSTWFVVLDAVEVLSEIPLVINISYSSTYVYRVDSIKIFTNGSDVEDEESDLTPIFEYKSPTGNWENNGISNINYNSDTANWEAKFTPSNDIESGFYDFRVKFIDKNNNESNWLEDLGKVEILNIIPIVEDISYSKNFIFRTDSIKIYVNGSDLENEESELICQLQYRANPGTWEDLTTKFVTDYWEATLTPDENAKLGFYDFRVNFIDSENASSGWFEDLDALEILNNIPSVINISYSAISVYRTESIKIYANGSDIENFESELECQIQYKSPSGTWIDLFDIIFDTNYWEIIFSPDEDAELGFYDFRVNFTDKDNSYSGWFEDFEVLEVINNIPVVVDIFYSANSVYRTESIWIYANGNDLENVESQLYCQIQYKSPSGTWIDIIDKKFEMNYWEIVFSPDENAELGLYDFRVKFTDKDNAFSVWLENFDQVEVNIKIIDKDPTAVIDKISPNPANANNEVWFYGNGTDDDGTIISYQWNSSIIGFLSNEKSFSNSDLSIGTHIISFKVKDNKEIWSEVVTEILEIKDNSIPKARITSPVEGEEFYENDLIQFDASKSSDVDNDKLTFIWMLNDVQISTTSEFDKTLELGNYRIELKVDDGFGSVDFTHVNISVIKIPEPLITFDENDIIIDGTPIVDKEIWIKVKINNPLVFNGNATIKFYCDKIDNDHLIAEEHISFNALKDTTITTPWTPKTKGICTIIVIIDNFEPNDFEFENNKAQKTVLVEGKIRKDGELVTKAPVFILVGLCALLTFSVAGTEIGRYKFLFPTFFLLYTKLKKEQVLDHHIRERIFDYIKKYPGANFAMVKNEIKTENGTLTHHLNTLEKFEYLKSDRDGHRVRFYPQKMKIPTKEERILTEISGRIIEIIKNNPGCSQKDITKNLGISPQLVNYHVNKFTEYGEVKIIKENGNSKCYFQQIKK